VSFWTYVKSQHNTYDLCCVLQLPAASEVTTSSHDRSRLVNTCVLARHTWHWSTKMHVMCSVKTRTSISFRACCNVPSSMSPVFVCFISSFISTQTNKQSSYCRILLVCFWHVSMKMTTPRTVCIKGYYSAERLNRGIIHLILDYLGFSVVPQRYTFEVVEAVLLREQGSS